jgi:hypothetical protein
LRAQRDLRDEDFPARNGDNEPAAVPRDGDPAERVEPPRREERGVGIAEHLEHDARDVCGRGFEGAARLLNGTGRGKGQGTRVLPAVVVRGGVAGRGAASVGLLIDRFFFFFFFSVCECVCVSKTRTESANSHPTQLGTRWCVQIFSKEEISPLSSEPPIHSMVANKRGKKKKKKRARLTNYMPQIRTVPRPLSHPTASTAITKGFTVNNTNIQKTMGCGVFRLLTNRKRLRQHEKGREEKKTNKKNKQTKKKQVNFSLESLPQAPWPAHTPSATHPLATTPNQHKFPTLGRQIQLYCFFFSNFFQFFFFLGFAKLATKPEDVLFVCLPEILFDFQWAAGRD